MQEVSGRNNARSLFTVETIPSDTHIRELLDHIKPSLVFPVFQWCFAQLREQDGLKDFKSKLGYLIALDGTQYASSEKIHCDDCLKSTEKKTGKITYYHTAVTPVMVKQGSEHVLSLVPEFITPQDGSLKQDCEINASKRLLLSHKEQALKDMEVTYLGDDLYAHEPFCRNVLETGHSFIFVCKPESHKTVYEWITGITKEKVIDQFDGKSHKIFTYTYACGVPLKDGNNALLVNFVEVTVTDRKTGKKLYHNAFVTNHPLQGVTEEETKKLLETIVSCGRTRWKIENENNNTLKTKGYHFEHNYGHGEKYLSSLLATLILLAFLFHTLLDLFCKPYQALRKKLATREEFFGSIRYLTRFYYATSWDHLFSSMKKGLETLLPLPEEVFATIPSG